MKTESQVLYEDPITKPEDPKKEGYTFTGWTPEVAETMPAEDVTYTATWMVNQYSMTFVLGNGEENEVLTQDYGTELTAPADPEKEGFTFKGWDPEVPATIPASDQTFTAQWVRNSYKLTWDVDGVKTESQVLYENPITKPEDPTKEGYTFTGWTPEVAETMPAEDVTYTATWMVNQYSMTFVFDNGEENEVLTQDYGTELTAPADPEKEGFTFKGWDPEVPATIPASDQTFTAQWVRNSYKLTWDVDGVKTESQVLYENPITKPEDPKKEGYTFTGWTPEVAETMPARDVTYTAQWEINVYKVTIADSENGTVEASTLAPEYGSEVVLTITPDETYLLQSLTVNGEDVTANVVEGLYTIEAVKTDITVEAIFVYDETTGINATRLASLVGKSVYNLNGNKVMEEFNPERLPQGVYIINGKKVLIK